MMVYTWSGGRFGAFSVSKGGTVAKGRILAMRGIYDDVRRPFSTAFRLCIFLQIPCGGNTRLVVFV